MVQLPPQYQWLSTIALPNTLRQGLALYGTTEKAGPANNPAILEWASECEIDYSADSIPWCGLYVALVVKRAGWEVVNGPLWARGWVNFGQRSDAGLGDILVFTRGSGGHVGFYVGEDDECYHVLGGNQGDAVNIIRISKARLLDSRRPLWKIKQPDSVRKYILDPIGNISQNEQ